jgi:small subunit ribosomal protein S21
LVGITVQENENIDKALKRFKKKYERSGVLKEYKKRTFFVKPSIEKRMDLIKAKRRASREQAMKDRKA